MMANDKAECANCKANGFTDACCLCDPSMWTEEDQRLCGDGRPGMIAQIERLTHELREARRPLDDEKLAGAIAFAREAWRANDGAEGETVRLICSELEKAKVTVSELEEEVNAAEECRDEAKQELFRVETRAAATEAIQFRAAVAAIRAYVESLPHTVVGFVWTVENGAESPKIPVLPAEIQQFATVADWLESQPASMLPLEGRMVVDAEALGDALDGVDWHDPEHQINSHADTLPDAYRSVCAAIERVIELQQVPIWQWLDTLEPETKAKARLGKWLVANQGFKVHLGETNEAGKFFCDLVPEYGAGGGFFMNGATLAEAINVALDAAGAEQ